MNKKLLRKKLALMLASLKKKRKYYCETEWIQTDNINSYIDTGIGGANNNLKFEMRFSTTSSQMYSAVFGNAREETENNWGIINGTGNNSYGYVNSIRNLGAYLFTTWTKDGKPNDLVLWRENNNAYLTINGTTVHASVSFGADNNSNIVLGRAGPTRVATEARYYNFYYFKIYDNGVLVRDMIPVLDWNYVPCMYDKVSGQLFYNAGTGDFTCGREIHPVDYIESTGTQYIDTGVNLTSNHSVEIDYQLTVAIQSRTGLFGILDGSTSSPRFGALISPSGNALESGYGTTNVYYQMGLPGTDRHVLKQEKNKLYYDGVLIYTFGTATFTTTTSSPLGNFKYTNYVPASAKYYSSKWWNGDTLIREYLPAIDENGVGFMFDRVSHTIYDNAGTGAFKYPAREVEYLESDGESFLDTQYVVQPEDIITFGSNSTYATGGSIDGAISSTSKRLHGFNSTANIYVGNSSYRVGSGLWDVNSIWKVDLKNGILHYGSHSVGMTGNYTSLPNVSFCFMARHNNISGDTYDNFKAGSRFTFFKVTRNGSLIRDFIPCYKDGQAGFLNKVDGTFFTNSGTGQFLTGKIVEPEYE